MKSEGHLSYCKRFRCLYLKNTAYISLIRSKSITTVGRHIWAVISTFVFDRKDFYNMMLSATCWR